MPIIFLRMNKRNSKLIRDYARRKNTAVYDLTRNAALEKIEDKIDLEAFDHALASMVQTYSLDEVKKELGL